MSEYILGLNVGNHDSAAALVKDGELISFIEQERISRNKMAIGEAPVGAILACLKMGKINFGDISVIALGMDWKYRNRIYRMSEEEKQKYINFENPAWYLPPEIFGKDLPPIHVVRHHLAHASSACRLSGFSECAVMVIDNRGEDASTSLGIAQKGNISFLRQVNIHNSLGIFYNRAAEYTGLYGKYREVGKFMGLAAYGNARQTMPLQPSKDDKLFKILPSIENESIFSSIGLRSKQLRQFFEENCFPYESGNIEEIMSYANFAASAQHALEEVILELAGELKKLTGMDNLALAGGVTLNCSANGKLEQSGLFKKIFVPPFASDSGTAAGAALELHHALHGSHVQNKRLLNAALGISYSRKETEEAMKKYRGQIASTYLDDEKLYEYVAKELTNGNIIAWVQGGFEAGPRALGNRSILADPRTRKSLIRLNKIKKREMWRPVAPSILAEDYSDYFEGDPGSRYFMNVAAIVKREKRKQVPAIVHVDNTARPQIVVSEHRMYYELLKAFKKHAGVPLLCNTSFNVQGMPLVNTPEDAIECFLKMELDLLVIGNIIIRKAR